MTRVALLVALVALLLAPAITGAQGGSPSDERQTPTDTQLQLERQHRRMIVRPSPPAEVVERDAEVAQAQVEQRQQQQEIVRELRRPQSRRPDLDYDVKSGIQSQRLNDARRR